MNKLEKYLGIIRYDAEDAVGAAYVISRDRVCAALEDMGRETTPDAVDEAVLSIQGYFEMAEEDIIREALSGKSGPTL